MKNISIGLFLGLLCTTFSTSAEETKYTEEQLSSACTYLDRFCEVTRQRCSQDQAANQDDCFMNYVGKIKLTQKMPKNSTVQANAELATEACQKLGDECAFVQLDCLSSGSSMFNSCVTMLYFKIGVAKERCGESDYKACLKSEEEFGAKIIHELTLPNVDKPIKRKMWEQCAKAGNYQVMSPDLKRFYHAYMRAAQSEKTNVPTEETHQYQIQEEYYHCMKSVLDKAS